MQTRTEDFAAPLLPLAAQHANGSVADVFVVHLLQRLQHVVRIREGHKP